MADIHDFPDVPGYVSIKQAAEMLGITDKRVYRYIDLGRLPAYKSGGVFLLAEQDVKQFKLNPPGRSRTTPPPWRVYNARSKVFATEIWVPVLSGQQEHLMEKLAEIQRTNHHVFPGTIARYILRGDPELTSLYFFFVWKDTDMPDDAARQRGFEELRRELAGELDWENAHMVTNEALLHT